MAEPDLILLMFDCRTHFQCANENILFCVVKILVHIIEAHLDTEMFSPELLAREDLKAVFSKNLF